MQDAFVPSEKGSFFDPPTHARRQSKPKARYDPSEGAPQRDTRPAQAPRPPRKPRTQTKFDRPDLEPARDANGKLPTALWSLCVRGLDNVEKREGAQRWRVLLPEWMQTPRHRHAHFDRLQTATRFANTLRRARDASHDAAAARSLASPVTSVAGSRSPSPVRLVEPPHDLPITAAAVERLAPTPPPSADSAVADARSRSPSPIQVVCTIADVQDMLDGDWFEQAICDEATASLLAHETLPEDDGPLGTDRREVNTFRVRMSSPSHIVENHILVADGAVVAGPDPALRPWPYPWASERGASLTVPERDGPFFFPLSNRVTITKRNGAPSTPTKRARTTNGDDTPPPKKPKRVAWADLRGPFKSGQL
jgi:hypothetical protein